MKIIQWIVLMLMTAVLTLTSCPGLFCPHPNPNFYDHCLLLSFQDDTGNDLVKGIESDGGMINRDQYSLMIEYAEPCQDTYPPSSIPTYYLRVVELNGYCYISINYSSSSDEGCPVHERKMSLRLACPYVFGDADGHWLVSYWNPAQREMGMDCYRLEIDGKEYVPSYENNGSQIAVILPEKKK